MKNRFRLKKYHHLRVFLKWQLRLQYRTLHVKEGSSDSQQSRILAFKNVMEFNRLVINESFVRPYYFLYLYLSMALSS